MVKEKLFLNKEFSEELKLEIKFLYEIGVGIQDLEYLINQKTESV